MARVGKGPPLALDRAIELIDQRLHPAAVLLFGSQAGETSHQGSDVDLGILLPRSAPSAPDAFRLADLRVDLEELLGVGVDLVLLDDASPILRMEVLRNHRVLLDRDPDRLEGFVVRTLGEYFDLKRVRAPIERALFSPEGPS